MSSPYSSTSRLCPRDSLAPPSFQSRRSHRPAAARIFVGFRRSIAPQMMIAGLHRALIQTSRGSLGPALGASASGSGSEPGERTWLGLLSMKDGGVCDLGVAYSGIGIGASAALGESPSREPGTKHSWSVSHVKRCKVSDPRPTRRTLAKLRLGTPRERCSGAGPSVRPNGRRAFPLDLRCGPYDPLLVTRAVTPASVS